VNRRFHLDRLTVECEAAVQAPGPEVEFLARVAQLLESGRRAVGTKQRQPQPAEIEAMRVLTQPLDVRGLGFIPMAKCRVFARSIAHGNRHQCVFDAEPLRIREAVPRPLRLGHQWHQRGVLVLEGLQPSNVRGEGDAAVADHQRRSRIDHRDPRAVAAHQGLAIDGRGRGRSRESKAQKDQRAFEHVGPLRVKVSPKGHGTCSFVIASDRNCGIFWPSLKPASRGSNR
jgi:hypothetical protein